MAVASPRIEHDPWYTSSPYEPVRPPVERIEDLDLLDFDLYRYGDPHAAWRMLRERAPVFWHERGSRGTDDNGFWALTRYEDAVAVYKASDRFTSMEGPFLDLRVEDTPRRILASLEGQPHRLRRSVVARAFTPQANKKWIESVRRTVTGILDDICEKGECDFSTDIAQRLPLRATCDMLGISAEEANSLSEMLHGLSAHSVGGLQQFNDATLGFFANIATVRRGSPAQDTIVDMVVHAELEGHPMSQEDVTETLWILFFGGIDSTIHALTGGMLSLFHHPDQLFMYRDIPALGPNAVEEILRWTSTSHANKRLVLEDVEIRGTKIRKGDYVSMWSPSANRDEQAFPDPYRFDIRREFSRKFPIATFGGGGPHQCLGQFFARLELEVLFGEVLRRLPNLEQAGPAVRSDHFTILLSPIKSLPIRFTPTPRTS